MEPCFKVPRKQVAHIIHATFPTYSGRKIMICRCESVRIHGLNWSGGSRSQYRSCTVTGDPRESWDRYNECAPLNNSAENQEYPLSPGILVVRHSIFAGKDSGLRIYVHPYDVHIF